MWIIIIIIVLALIFLRFYSFKLQIKPVVASSEAENIKGLIRQVYRWHIASQQDAHPMIKMLHSNYASGYLQALRTVSNDDAIYALTGLEMGELEAEIAREQDKSVVGLGKLCPGLGGDYQAYKKYLGVLAKF